MIENSNSGGVGFFGLLTCLFIGLKLAKIIDWSWWVVLLPLYGSIILVFAFLLAAAIFYTARGRK